MMLEDFILKALLMGVVFSCLAGPLGSVMVWRRLAFFGDTISHSALLGLGVSLLLQLPSQLTLSLFCVTLAIILTLIPFRSKVSVDSILAIFSHGSLALGLVMLALMDRPPLSLTGFLFGDILALTWGDIMTTALAALGVGALTYFFWRSLLTTFISEELAKSEGVPTLAIKIGFAMALGLTIGLLLQTVGALLMTAMLIIPASCARYLSRSPAQMIVIAIGVGILSFGGGMWSSYILDTPTAPMIVVSALGFFILSRLVHFKMKSYSVSLLILFLFAFSQQAVFATEKGAALLCQKHIVQAEKKLGIPTGLLAAISIIESGKKAQGHDDLVAWPWVINVAGKPEYYKTKTHAIKALNKYLDLGKVNIDVGCMQVNYRHHGAEFRSPTYMMDPRQNVNYAAKFLKDLRQQHGSWTKAVGHYHSGTLKHQTPYRHKVYRKWQKVRHDQRRNSHKPSLMRTHMSEQSKRLLRSSNDNLATRKTGYEIIRPKEPAVFHQGEALTVAAVQKGGHQRKAQKTGKTGTTINIPTIQQLHAQQLSGLIHTNKRTPYFFKK